MIPYFPQRDENATVKLRITLSCGGPSENSGEKAQAVLVATKEAGGKLVQEAGGINSTLDQVIRALQKSKPCYPSPNAG